jgi:hypothetical protein
MISVYESREIAAAKRYNEMNTMPFKLQRNGQSKGGNKQERKEKNKENNGCAPQSGGSWLN